MGRDGALAHGEDLLQLGDGELLSAEKQQDAEPVGVGDDAKSLENGRHGCLTGEALL
jgi:hypothetical protein